MTQRATLSVLLVAAALVGAPGDASACSAAACQPVTVAAEGGVLHLPATAPGVRLEPGFDPSVAGPVTPLVRLFEVDPVSGEYVEQAVRVEDDIAIPEIGFRPDAQYELEVRSECLGEPVTDVVMIVTGAEASLPGALGALHAGSTTAGSVPAPVSTGSCYEDIAASYVDVSVELDPTTSPWSDALVWETLVDGAPYAPRGTLTTSNPWGLPGDYSADPRGSWRGPARDRVYAACDPTAVEQSEGVAEGPHEVVMRAYVPGTDVVLETAPVIVELACAVEPPTYEDPSCPSGMYGPQGQCHPGYGDEPPPSDHGDGVAGCSAAPGGHTPGGVVLVMLAALGVIARRRVGLRG